MGDQIQLVERVFDVLEYLSQSPVPKGPTQVAQALDMSKSTVYRLLNSLQMRGYVEKSESGGTYRIGIKLVEVASNHINNLELQTEARPYLIEMQTELGLIVHLGILDGHEVVYVEKLDLSPNIRGYTQIGLRVPAQCSSLGKCILAQLSGDQLDYLMSSCKFEQYTPNTITDLADLKTHLRLVRQQGWAMDNEEYILGHRCVGAPIYDYRGEIIAAVSASGPTTLFTNDLIPQVTKRIQTAAEAISRRLCYQLA
ncbi:MAG: IclR family transcriptional regulator [Coriobacteriales bacterium]|jgi:DNA-binding IclR family transcriptional regulator|nr:IclR family transcriptional regulator [Coriobacteriales bacterium]